MTPLKKIVIDLSPVVSRLNNFYVRNVDFLPIFQEKKNIYIIYIERIETLTLSFLTLTIKNIYYEGTVSN